ncbi:Mevalonate kinase [Trachymyrmex septentrionalis]|uniref:Mevalonate kinase n=1 Tax=Trachymyrmex septentrionalis TaxID=34720 RepID=A0A195FAR9_9HYME|nr:Mevalonate kinase [Trachymyrmex septentrionalis]
MIHFKISAPGRMSLFGEHAVKYKKNSITASIDLRTTMTFTDLSHLPSKNSIEIDFPQIYIHLNIPLQEFLKFYNNSIQNMKLLHEQIVRFTNNLYSPPYRKEIVQTFYYLLVYILYKEQITISSFKIYVSTKFMIDEEFACLSSFTVCLTACLLHWSRVQKGIIGKFQDTDFKKIQSYAARCEEISPASGKIDVTACVYGSIIEQRLGIMTLISLHKMPKIMILLIDSKVTQNLDCQTQRVTELINIFPQIGNLILKNIDIATIMAHNIFKKINKMYSNNISFKRISQTNEELNIYISHNQKLLQMLGVSYDRLNEICAIAQKFKLFGKYTDIGNGRYAYVWCPLYTDKETFIELLWNELKKYDCDIMKVYLSCCGVKIESEIESACSKETIVCCDEHSNK